MQVSPATDICIRGRTLAINDASVPIVTHVEPGPRGEPTYLWTSVPPYPVACPFMVHGPVPPVPPTWHPAQPRQQPWQPWQHPPQQVSQQPKQPPPQQPQQPKQSPRQSPPPPPSSPERADALSPAKPVALLHPRPRRLV